MRETVHREWLPNRTGTTQMYDFTYHRPASIDEAARLMAGADDGKYVSGGMTLIPTLKQRLAQPSDLIDLGGLANSGIDLAGNMLTIKAGTIHEAVSLSSTVQQAIPALASRQGYVEHVAHAKHASLLGAKFAEPIVRGVAHVLHAAER